MAVPLIVTEYARAARSERTKEAYRDDWKDYSKWARDKNFLPLPSSPDAVALYLAERAETLKPSTLARRLVGIRTAHKLAGFDLPTNAPVIRDTLTGIKRQRGSALSQKAPLTIDNLREICKTEKTTRNRAILVVGFAAALRRSEIAALNHQDVSFVKEGLILFLPQRKNDQEGKGTSIGITFGSHIHTCPVRSLRDWLAERGTNPGPLFTTKSGRRFAGQDIAAIVKQGAVRIGLDPKDYGGHSLRAGFATEAARAGASERSIMRQTGHRSIPMVRRYIREGSIFTENAAALIDL
ncbi:MAG: tyrosine-type recombinase/integrase [Phycisphaeraceae bacterium]|nr:tyrosine-type recombinase/integrase [Phycisphaeraceae bacterium]